MKNMIHKPKSTTIPKSPNPIGTKIDKDPKINQGKSPKPMIMMDILKKKK